jgi:hypothetical protein
MLNNYNYSERRSRNNAPKNPHAMQGGGEPDRLSSRYPHVHLVQRDTCLVGNGRYHYSIRWWFAKGPPSLMWWREIDTTENRTLGRAST